MPPLPTGTEARLNKLQGVKAVLFDVYGTLFVSGSGDVGTAAATNTAEALTQALVVAGYEGEMEQAGMIGKEMLKAVILEWHQAGHEAGTDCPEVEITKVWKKIIDTLRHTETLKAGETDFDQLRRLAVEYECRVNPVFPMPGCLETIRQIKEHGLALGIVSNAQFYTPLLFPAFFGQTVEKCGFDPECCVWSYKELKAKPSAALFPKAGKFLRKNHGNGLCGQRHAERHLLRQGGGLPNRAVCRRPAVAADARKRRTVPCNQTRRCGYLPLPTFGDFVMLNAVIFDFDGIIVDSEPMHYQAFQQVLIPEGVEFSWEEYCEEYIGYDDRDAFKAAFNGHGIMKTAGQVSELIGQKAQVFQQLVHDGKATPLPGAVELIKSIPRKLPLALCSGALKSDIEPILANLGIEDAFRVIVTAEDTDKSKPDPAPYQHALEKLGIEDASTAIAIEDTPAGIVSAKGAGLKVLAVTNSYDREYLLEADAVTDSLENVTRLSLEDMVL